MATAISHDFPASAFTQQSLFSVSKKCRFFPSHGELHQALEEWWKDNRPAPKALPGPSAASLNDEEQYWVRSWQRHQSGDWGKAKDGTSCSGPHKHLRFELELMKKTHPEAFRWLVLHDKEAGRIAALAGWTDGPTSPTDEERQAVARAAKEALQAIRRANIPKGPDATDQLKALAEATREEFRKKNGRYPGELSREQLEKLREQNPALKQAARKAA